MSGDAGTEQRPLWGFLKVKRPVPPVPGGLHTRCHPQQAPDLWQTRSFAAVFTAPGKQFPHQKLVLMEGGAGAGQ